MEVHGRNFGEEGFLVRELGERIFGERILYERIFGGGGKKAEVGTQIPQGKFWLEGKSPTTFYY